ncbi:FAD binding domain-containing protein [Sporohalobacter salinus]|uniref:FAD binding domain-containing protein n=1 Tax=Sporohalobacter salinus TaxID=1494606 RepID=UPI001EF8DAB5|nr:xanthine dehydrogenase family protein subunit M [Sporohalobacter salinus]MBM7622496.1 CO/xanthine dehydrogenase FAD-binding subunit [Sporohalobacter salinus]
MMKEYIGNVKNRPGISGKDFKGYFVPETIKEAVELLADKGDELEILAGGTDLLVDYYEHLYEVSGWLDLRDISQLQEIKVKEDRMEIGAMVTHSQLVNSFKVKDHFPLISQAAEEVGSPQIRSRGTIGGNIVTGSPAGDLLPPLLAYQAELELVDKESKKRIAIEDFFIGPKETVIQSDQMLSKIIITLPQPGTLGSWIKIGKRKALAISTISLALVVRLDQQEQIQDIRACLGAVAPTPLEIEEVRDKMLGRKLSEIDFTEIGLLVAENISPIDDIRGTREYRKDIAKNLVITALKKLASGGEG